MALVECRRFPLLPEALVARSALAAAGLHPVVFDEHWAAVNWTEQFALRGIRLMVPDQELDAANALLLDLDPPPQTTLNPRTGPPTFKLLIFLLASIAISWPLAGFRRPTRFHQMSALAISAVLIFAYLVQWRAYLRF